MSNPATSDLSDSAAHGLLSLLCGIDTFTRKPFPQSAALLLSSCDSRTTSERTALTRPGELFVRRNAFKREIGA